MQKVWIFQSGNAEIGHTVFPDELVTFSYELSLNAEPPAMLPLTFRKGRYNSDRDCFKDCLFWNEGLTLLTGHTNQGNNNRTSLQEYIETLTWRVRPLSGILEILASDTVVWTTPITNVNGPICLYCDRHVNRIYRAATKSCKSCRSNFMTTLFPPNPRFLNLSKKEVRRDKTLVFLCARLSSGDELTEGYFDKIATSLKQSEGNPGRFGKFNRPGLPAGMEVVGKFVARATATTNIDTRYERTINAEADWQPMNLLPEFVVHRYWPGNTVLIGMSTPSCLTVLPNHLKTLIEEIYVRGIPKDSIFLLSLPNATNCNSSKYESTVVLAHDLLIA